MNLSPTRLGWGGGGARPSASAAVLLAGSQRAALGAPAADGASETRLVLHAAHRHRARQAWLAWASPTWGKGPPKQ